MSTARFESAAVSGRPRRLRSCALRVSTLQPTRRNECERLVRCVRGEEKGQYEPRDLNRGFTLRDDQYQREGKGVSVLTLKVPCSDLLKVELCPWHSRPLGGTMRTRMLEVESLSPA